MTPHGIDFSFVPHTICELRLLLRSLSARWPVSARVYLTFHCRNKHHNKEKLFGADLRGEGSQLDISSILDESGVTVFPLLWHI